MSAAKLLIGLEREHAKARIVADHYTRSVPSGKSHFVEYESAIVVWSIPANKNCARFLLPKIEAPKVWELSRLWAPDGHERNLLTRAISRATKLIIGLEDPDLLVSYADPNVGHSGGVYRAASWEFHGQSEETRSYERDGQRFARRAFHSGRKGKTKAELAAEGFREIKAAGKFRFIKPLSRRARRLIGAIS